MASAGHYVIQGLAITAFVASAGLFGATVHWLVRGRW